MDGDIILISIKDPLSKDIQNVWYIQWCKEVYEYRKVMDLKMKKLELLQSLMH